MPVSAHGLTQLLAAAENTVILVVIALSLAHLRLVPRAARQRPYVLMCLLYSIGFIYLFAALGNLGLITRERTLLLPFMLVLLALPIAPRGHDPYPWQTARGRRRRSPSTLTDADQPRAEWGAGVGPGQRAEPEDGWQRAEWVWADWSAGGRPDAEVPDRADHP